MDEIWAEIRHCLIIITIIAYVVLAADIYDRQVFWDETYQHWTVNENPQEGTGFHDAMIDPQKRR